MDDQWADRAKRAYDAMQASFFVPRLALYRETAPPIEQPFAFCWPAVRALAAANDLAGLPNTARDVVDQAGAVLSGLEHYWDVRHRCYASVVMPPLGDGGDAYYDDNAWAGLELLRTHRLTGDAHALERARAIFDFLLTGWDDDQRHPSPGGVFWVAAGWNRDRNTVSTAPSAQLALRLAALAPDDEQRWASIEWARRMADWLDGTLRRDDNLYADHIALDGTIDQTIWSYNQGTTIDLMQQLYAVTGETRYQNAARRTAVAARDMLTPETLEQHDLAFNAIYLSNLARYARAWGDDDWLVAPREHAERLWAERVDGSTGLTTTSNPPTLLDQSALVSMFAILASVDDPSARMD